MLNFRNLLRKIAPIAIVALAFVALGPNAHAQAGTYCATPNQTNCTENILVSWTPPVIPAGATNPTSYDVMRSTTSGSESLIITIDFGTNSWIDAGKGGGGIVGQIYYYEIIAVYATGNSVPSNEISATFPAAPVAAIPTPAPTDATATPLN